MIGRFLLLVLFALLPSVASAQPGVFISQTAGCTGDTRYTSPITGRTYCFDQVTNQLKKWNGSAWVGLSPTGLPVIASEGGTGLDTSALTGVPSLATGTWSIGAVKPPTTGSGAGIFAPTACSAITSPVSGTSECLDTTRGVWNNYDNVGWQSDAARSTLIVNAADPRWGATFTEVSIQNAIDYVTANGGGTVLCPQNKIVLKSGVTWATITMKDHVKLLGPLGPLGERGGQSGKGCVLRNNDDIDTLTYATTGDASLGTVVQGLTFEGTGTGNDISVPSGSNRLSILDNSFNHPTPGKGNGIRLTDAVYQIYIERNTFYNQTSHHIYITGTSGPGPGLYIRDNYFSVLGTSARHIYYDNTVAVANVEITGNTFAGPVSGAALVQLAGGGVRGVLIRGNDFENFTGQAALVVTGTTGVIGPNAISSGATGISLVAGNNMTIGGNRFGSLTGNAIALDGSSNSNVILPNSGGTPVSDGGVGTVWFTQPSDETANISITSTGLWRQRVGAGFDVNNTATFTDGIAGRGAGSGWSLYTAAAENLRLNNDKSLQLITAPVAVASGTIALVPTITEKKGSGAGAYSTASASYVDIDATNLAYTVTIPVGMKLAVTAYITTQDSTLAAAQGFAIFDTQPSAVISETVNEAEVAANREQMVLTAVITGDGNAHTVKLQFKTSAGTMTVSNSSTSFTPRMLLLLSPSP